jgi:hypothetical protein
VEPVDHIDICMPNPAEHRRGASGPAGASVACQVLGTTVGLRLYDRTSAQAVVGLAQEPFSKQVAGYRFG